MENTNKKTQENVEKKARPSYASSGQAESALEIFRRINPKKIDLDFVVGNNLATKSNAFRILDLYRWFGIIDGLGNVNLEYTAKLRLVGNEREEFVTSLIKNSYKELFDEVTIAEAKKDDIINFFIRKYGYAPISATFATSLFINLCQKYGISISDDIKNKVSSITDKKLAENRRRSRIDNKAREPKETIEDLPKEKKPSEEQVVVIGENKYIINIVGKDGRNNTLPVNSLEDIEEVEFIINRLKKSLS